ncbi:hypothetical protein NDU88_006263 [Pleurodeles waltl]|uniref:Uncharacterized protein n=1 Tax=Pleurodeles waltl TaxID=8319 RepID=A0AAV7PLA9_PLEWA|nr:hypothetical protein NDU88_006263 [Pleurodeles waltl]
MDGHIPEEGLLNDNLQGSLFVRKGTGWGGRTNWCLCLTREPCATSDFCRFGFPWRSGPLEESSREQLVVTALGTHETS